MQLLLIFLSTRELIRKAVHSQSAREDELKKLVNENHSSDRRVKSKFPILSRTAIQISFALDRRNGTEQTNDLALIESRLALIGREKDLWSAATL